MDESQNNKLPIWIEEVNSSVISWKPHQACITNNRCRNADFRLIVFIKTERKIDKNCGAREEISFR